MAVQTMLQLVLSIFICRAVKAQAVDDAIATTIPECLQLVDHYFCNPDNVSINPNRPAYEGFGYCCPNNSLSPNCQDGQNGLTCTMGSASVQGEPLYKTFWVGLDRGVVCNSTAIGITASEEKEFFYASNLVIGERDSIDYEACHWIVEVEDNKYRDDTDAFIELRFEKLKNTEAYIYEGTGTSNATAFIEGNATAVAGVPYRAPISSKLIVVMTTSPNGLAGSGEFSYQLFDTEEYAFFYQPYVGQAKWLWYATLCAVAVAPFIVLIICICCCKYVRCCRHCCSFCLCDCCWEDTASAQKTNKTVPRQAIKVSKSPANLDKQSSPRREGTRRLSVQQVSEQELREISDIGENDRVSDAETVQIAGGLAGQIAMTDIRSQRSGRNQGLKTQDEYIKTHVSPLNISERPNFDYNDPGLATFDRTIGPESVELNPSRDDRFVNRPQFEHKYATKYSLKPEKNDLARGATMYEIPPPPTGLLGGLSQSQAAAPVQFYRFTNERKRKMQQDLYQDPFNPMNTEGNEGAPARRRDTVEVSNQQAEQPRSGFFF